jgi:hypothetical protein
MLVIMCLVTAFVLLPALLGYIFNVCGSPEKRMWYFKKAEEVKLWGAINYSMAVFITCTAVLYIVVFLAVAGIRLDPTIYVGLLSLSCLTALVYLFYYWGIPRIVTNYVGVFKLLIGALAIGVATLSKIYSDSGISELTGLSPQDLPGAQLLLTFLLTPIIWFLGLSLLLGYLSSPVLVILLLRSLYRDHLKKKCNDENHSGLSDMAALFAVALFVIILLATTQKIASKNFYEVRLKQAIVFASFHMPTTYCGLSEEKGVGVAPMSDGRAAIAIPDGKLSYRFELIICDPKSKTVEEVKEILEEYQSIERNGTQSSFKSPVRK